MRYSGLKVITEGLFGNKGWTPAWRDPAPQATVAYHPAFDATASD